MIGRFLYVAAILAVWAVFYEAVQPFRPTDFSVALDRWWFALSGVTATFLLLRVES